MSMGRPLRRSLSPQIRDRLSSSDYSATSSGSFNMLQNGGGGGSVVFAVEKAYNEHNAGHKNHKRVSSLTSLTGDFSTTSSHKDSLFSFANFLLVLPWPCFRIVGMRGGSVDRLPQNSSRGTFWKRPMLQLLLCLVLGMVMGLTSLSWSGFPSSPRRNEAPRNLASVNGFVSNLQREGFISQGLGSGQDSGNGISRGEKSIENISSRVIQGAGADNSGELQIEQLKSGLLAQLAPGLNYTLDPERKLLIIVTPTYNRPFQAYYLTRLAHTLRLVPPPLLWLVVEMQYQTLETARVLMQTGIMYRHLVCRTNLTLVKDRVVHQRNFALEHIEMHRLNGIVYFADDDNVYSHELFEEMRKIRLFGTWPVAILAEGREKTLLEGPVCDNERVIGWHTNEKSKNLRRFHVDMSGFAFNSTMLWDTVNWRHRNGQPVRHVETFGEGLQESAFIEQLVEDEDQMLGLPSGCSKVMVWHLHMEAPELNYPYEWSLAKPLFPNIPFQTQK